MAKATTGARRRASQAARTVARIKARPRSTRGSNSDAAGRYYVQIMVTIADKVFVIRSNLRSITSFPALNDAIPKAFEVTLGKIRKHLQSRDR